jgi:SulP family sulfate permease
MPGPLRGAPGPLVALVVITILQAIFSFDGVATIGSAFGGIPPGLPSWHWPDVTGAKVIELIGPAFAIEMLGAIESLLSAVVADGMAGTRHDPNQELIGRGLPIRSRRSSADSRRPARLRGRRRISATAGRVR